MRCAACDTPLADGARFCSSCGHAVGSCPTCGAALSPGARFCSSCGTPLAGASTAPDVAAAPTTERRVCSILFCDLVSFTSRAEVADTEDVRELLTRYFDVTRTAIERHGGTVEKFIGDAVMAVWGTPVVTEDDPERAVRAALEVVQAVAALSVDAGHRLEVRVGVVTGEVAVTVGATNQGMVAGDPVNTAARVQAAAEPGQVLVDHVTAQRVGRAIELADEGWHPLKGKVEPQRLWRAVRALSAIGGLQRVDGLEAPLVGRDVELRMLKDLFHATVDRQTGRLVLVEGEAGSGKSRLGWEFEKYVDGLAVDVWWHRSRCLSYGQGVAFWALAEMVRQRLGIAEEDGPDVALPLLVAGVERFVLDPGERLAVGPALGRLLGLRPPGDDGRELSQAELFAGWTTWLLRLADTAGMVWVVEDVQHADPALLAFVDHLLDRSRRARVHVLGLSRPEVDEVAPGWTSRRHRHRIVLEPLDDGSVRRLLTTLVTNLSAEDTDRMVAQARGVPLFAVETVRALIDQGVVVVRDGVRVLTTTSLRLDLPDTLRAIIAARLDHLPAAEREAVGVASVLGSAFTGDGLAAMAGTSAAELTPVLESLVARELVEMRLDPLSPEVGTYRFVHELVRQVAYQTLSRRERKRLHLAAADHLRATFPSDGEEVADVVARHLVDASESVPDAADAESIRARAVVEYVRAGERAARTGAQQRAATGFARAAALDLTAGRGGLWERASKAAQLAGRLDEAMDHARAARECFTEIGDRRAAARSNALLGRAQRLSGQWREARASVELALADGALEPAGPDTVEAQSELAALDVFEHTDVAESRSRAVLSLAQTLGVPTTLLARSLMLRGLYHSYAGEMAECSAYMREAARVADLVPAPEISGMVFLNLSSDLCTSDFAQARDLAHAAIERCRDSGSRLGFAHALDNLTDALLGLGDWDEGETVLRTSLEEGLDDFELVSLDLSQLLAMRGRTAEARAQLPAGELELSEDPDRRCKVALVRAFMAYADERPDTASSLAQNAFEHYPVIGLTTGSVVWAWTLATRCADKSEQLETLDALIEPLSSRRPGELPPMLWAELALVEAKRAGEPLEAAVAEVARVSTPWHHAHALLDLAMRNPSRRDALVKSATEIAERLGCLPLTDRAERVLRGSGGSP